MENTQFVNYLKVYLIVKVISYCYIKKISTGPAYRKLICRNTAAACLT